MLSRFRGLLLVATTLSLLVTAASAQTLRLEPEALEMTVPAPGIQFVSAGPFVSIRRGAQRLGILSVDLLPGKCRDVNAAGWSKVPFGGGWDYAYRKLEGNSTRTTIACHKYDPKRKFVAVQVQITAFRNFSDADAQSLALAVRAALNSAREVPAKTRPKSRQILENSTKRVRLDLSASPFTWKEYSRSRAGLTLFREGPADKLLAVELTDTPIIFDRKALSCVLLSAEEAKAAQANGMAKERLFRLRDGRHLIARTQRGIRTEVCILDKQNRIRSLRLISTERNSPHKLEEVRELVEAYVAWATGVPAKNPVVASKAATRPGIRPAPRPRRRRSRSGATIAGVEYAARYLGIADSELVGDASGVFEATMGASLFNHQESGMTARLGVMLGIGANGGLAHGAWFELGYGISIGPIDLEGFAALSRDGVHNRLGSAWVGSIGAAGRLKMDDDKWLRARFVPRYVASERGREDGSDTTPFGDELDISAGLWWPDSGWYFGFDYRERVGTQFIGGTIALGEWE